MIETTFCTSVIVGFGPGGGGLRPPCCCASAPIGSAAMTKAVTTSLACMTLSSSLLRQTVLPIQPAKSGEVASSRYIRPQYLMREKGGEKELCRRSGLRAQALCCVERGIDDTLIAG